MEVFQKVNRISMFVTFGVAWLLINLSMSWILCDNEVWSRLHFNSQEALEKYLSEQTSVCRFWQDVMDSRFDFFPLPFESAAIYSAIIIVLAACIEITWVYMGKQSFPVHDESNDWKTFVFVRGGLFVVFLFVSMAGTMH